jgi:hypothetical protein
MLEHVATGFAIHGGHDITITTHDEPVGRDRSNYIVQARVDADGWREQLWTRQIGTDRFEIACLPFFTYGICNRDVVTLDAESLVREVVAKSGHRTLRVALVQDHPQVNRLHETLHGLIAATGLAHEWHMGTYLAVDLPPGTEPEPLITTLEARAQVGTLHWEIDA